MVGKQPQGNRGWIAHLVETIEYGFKVGCLGAGAIAQWVEFLSRMHKVQVHFLALQTLDMVVHTHNLGT